MISLLRGDTASARRDTRAAMRVLRKYSNRRLYDTVDSRYVNLDEVAGLVRNGEDLRVEDARSGADLTRETLLQVILERDGGADLLPPALLRRIIRVSSGDPASARVRHELAAGLEALHEQLDRAEALYTRTTGQDPAAGWAAAWQAWSAAGASTVASPGQEAPSGWPAGIAPEDLAASMANAWRETLARAQGASQAPPPVTPYDDVVDDGEPAPPAGPAFPNGRPAAPESVDAPVDPRLDALRARLAELEARLRG